MAASKTKDSAFSAFENDPSFWRTRGRQTTHAEAPNVKPLLRTKSTVSADTVERTPQRKSAFKTFVTTATANTRTPAPNQPPHYPPPLQIYSGRRPGSAKTYGCEQRTKNSPWLSASWRQIRFLCQPSTGSHPLFYAGPGNWRDTLTICKTRVQGGNGALSRFF